MAISVASLTASLNLESSGFQSGLRTASGSLNQFASAAQSHAASTEGAFGGITARAVALGNVLSNVATGAIGALGNMARSAVGAVAGFEQMTAKLTALTAKELVDAGQFKDFDAALGAATEKSKTLLAWTQQLAVASPFEEGDVSAVLGVASAFGFLTQKYQTVKEAQDAGVISAQRLTNAILNFGAATGVSGANLDSIARVAGQIQSIGKLMGGDSMQLKNFGINIEEAIGQSIGKTTQQVIEMREKGLVTADMALQALVGSMEKFGKAAELQGGSLGGLLASLSDLQKVAMRNIFGPMFESLKPALAGAVTALQSPEVGAAMQNFGNSIGAGVATALSALQGLASQAQGLMSAFAAGLSTGGAGGGVSSLLAALGLDEGLAAAAGAVLNGVVSAVQGGVGQIQSAMTGAASVWQSFMAAAGAAASQIGPALAQVAATVQGVLGSAFQTLGAVASTVFAGLPALIQAVAGPISTIASAVGSFLVSAFQSFGQIAQSVFAGLPGLAQTVMGVFTAFASFVGSTLASAFQVILPIASSVFAGIATVVSMALPGLFAVANAVGSLLAAAFNALQGVATAVFNAILPYVPALQAYIAALAVIVGSVLGAAFNWLAGVIRGTVIPAIQTAGAWLAQNLPGAIQVVMNFITGTLLPGLLNLATWLMQNLPGAIQTLSGFWTGVLQPAIATVWGFITGTLFPLFQQLIGWLQTSIPQGLAALSGFWQEHKDQIVSIAQTAWDLIKGAIDGVLKTITTLWSAFQSAREGDWRGFGEKLRTIWDDAWEAIKTAVTTIGPQIASAVGTLATDAKNKFLEIDWKQLGVDVIKGIGEGVTSMGGWLAGLARDAASKMLDAAKGFLGIQSPSKVMAEQVGVPMAQGIAAGFAAGLDGAGLVAIVAGIRRVMEQIGAVLKGVGDKVSTSDWEDLAGPIKLMADTFKAMSDIGASLAQENMAANWETARQQAGAMIASARAILTDLAALLKGVGDKVSTSDWEDFTAPLKMLADSLASISQISALFEDGAPSLAGLGGLIRQLAVDARALLVDLDGAIEPISAGLPDKLKTLGDAASAARSVADGALGLVRSLQEALTVDWGAIDWPAAGVMMHDLAGMVRWFASKAEEASIAIAAIDTTGLAPLKAAAENLIGVADGARGLVARLVDALTVNWAGINWPAAGRMMHDLAQMVVYFAGKAAEAAAKLQAVDTTGLAPLRAAAELLQGSVDATLGLVKGLVVLLQSGMPPVDADDLASRFVGPLVTLGVKLSLAANNASQALVGINTAGLDKLKGVIGGLLDTFQGIVDLVDFTLGNAIPDALARLNAVVQGLQRTMDTLGVAVTVRPEDVLRAILDPILALGVALTQIVAQGTAALSGLDTSGYDKLASVMGNAQETLKKIVDLSDFILDLFANGGLFDAATRVQAILADLNSRLAGLGQGPATVKELLRQMLDPLLALGVALTEVVAEATAALANVETGGLSKLNEAIGGLKTALEGIPHLIQQILTDWRQGWPDIDPDQAAQLVIDPLLALGMALARHAAAATASLSTLETGGLSKLNDAVGGLQGALEGIPKLLRQILTTWQQGWPDLDPDQVAQLIFTPLFTLGIELARGAETAAAGMAGVTTGALKALSDAVALVLGAVTNTLDLLKLLNTALANGPIDLPDTLHAELVGFLTDYAALLADAFLASANAFTGKVGDGAKTLQDAIGGAVSVAKNALDLLKLFGEALANGPIAMPDTLHEELVGFLTDYASLLASAFLTSANAFTGKVGDGAKALQDAIGGAVSVAKNALDLLKLFGEALANGPIPLPDTLHEELVGFLTDYASLLASAFLTSANAFTGKVGDGAKVLQDAIGGAVSVAKNALDLLKLFGEALAHGPIDLPDTLHAELVGFLTDYAVLISDAFLLSANAFKGKVTDAAKQLVDATGTALDVVKSVLEFSQLRAALASFKPLDMTVYGPKIDLIFQAAQDIAARFIAKAKTANISQAMQDAAGALAQVFGDAAGSLNDALDLGARLLDPETQIPSIGQIDAKLTAILALVQAVTTRFAAQAATIGPDTAKSAEGLSSAVKSVFDAISQVIAAVKDAADLYLGTSGFNNITALLTYLFDTFDQFAGRAEGVNAVTAAITSLLGGIEALVAASGFSAGQSWASQFAAGVAAGTAGATVATAGAASSSRATTTATGGGGSAVTNNNYTVNVTLSSAAGLPDTLTLLSNMARG